MEYSGFKEIGPPSTVTPPDEVDRLLAKADWTEGDAPALYVVPNVVEELQATTEMQRILPLIAKLIAAEAAAKGKRVYPTKLLRHQHIIAAMVLNPFITRVELCRFFGVSIHTLGNIAKSDTFRALASQFQVQLTEDESIADKMKDTLSAALDVTQKAIIEGQDPDYALQVVDKAANRLGMGVKQGTQVNIQNNVVTPDMIAYARQRRLSGA